MVTGLTAGAVWGAEGPAAAVRVEAQEAGRDMAVTFAHPFREGDIKRSPVLKIGGQEIPAQVAVKRRYGDGSVKHAIISAALKEVRPGQSLTLDIYGGEKQSKSGSAGMKLPEGFSADVVFTFSDGNVYRAKAGDFMQKAKEGIKGYRQVEWLAGPLVREVQLAGAAVDEEGKGDPDLLVLFGLRTFKGSSAVRVEVVVESPWVDVPGNIPYDVKVLIDGKEAMARANVGYWDHRLPYWLKDKDRRLGHFAHARWRKVFWSGEKPAEVQVKYDFAYLAATGLIPPYDTNVEISREHLEWGLKNWEGSPRDILENGIIMAYMPTTGGREDLGPYPGWTTRYLFSQDRGAWEMVLGTGELGGSFAVHIRDRVSGRIFSLDEHPGYSLNKRGTLEKIAPREAGDRPWLLPATSPYQVDNAHQPSLAFIPYLLTGEYYYLEEIYFWANWCMLIQNAQYREKEKGLVSPDQTRGEAWALRQIVDAAKIAPDDHPEKDYFEDKVKHNLDFYNRFIAGEQATPLGTYTAGASDAYVRGRSPEERRKWLTLAPWQQNFLAWSLDHAVRAGYEEAAGPRDYFTRTQAGALTHPEVFDPQYGASYFLVVGERINEKVRYYTTWKELFDKSFRVVEPDAKGDVSGQQNYGSSYAYIGRAVLLIGAANKVAGAKEALAVMESYLPGRAKVLSEDPTWNFAP